MFERCFNPDCRLPFNYREGRLIRFCPIDSGSRAEHPGVEHFWLCGKCSKRYVFVHQGGAGVKIKFRVEESQETAVRTSAATA